MIGLAPLAAAQAIAPPSDSYPQLSPDGGSLVFQSNRSGRPALWMSRPDGSEPRMLFGGADLGERPTTPAWSPDGRSIAFAMRPAGSSDPEESEIYVMDASGEHVRRLTEAPGDDSHPHWTADGSRIFFNSARATPDLKAEWSRQWIDIYSFRPDGSDLRRHTDCRTICTYPWPSPDGRWLAYRRVLDGPGRDWGWNAIQRNSEIFVARIDGSEPRNVTNHPAFDGWPTWSPDGRWVVFASNRDGNPYRGQIYALRAGDSAPRALTSGGWSRAQPAFAPDSRHILVYESQEDGAGEQGHLAIFEVALPTE
jgi:TolB protein